MAQAYDAGLRVACDVPAPAAPQASEAPEAAASSPTVAGKISVDVAAEAAEVNPHMYGIFFEEINHAGDGGLYAELVRNRSFEDCNVPEGMQLENGFAVGACRDKIPWPPKEPVPAWQGAAKGNSTATFQLDNQRSSTSAAPQSSWKSPSATPGRFARESPNGS